MQLDPHSPVAVHGEAPALPKITLGEVGARVLGLARGVRLTLIGIDCNGVGDALRAGPAGPRGALLLATGGGSAEAVLHQLLDDLAALALAAWPRWYGAEAPVSDVMQRAAADPAASLPWLEAAARRGAARKSLRSSRTAKAAEFQQLMLTFGAAAPILIAALDPASPARAAPLVQALEWCAAHGASVVVSLPALPPATPPYDRVLYGAFEVMRAVEPVRSRFIAPRAHHASVAEQRLESALRRDTELGPLFSGNETVAITGPGTPPRVDLLWREGRIVVELDGPEHQRDPNFAIDRHRDYELLVAGYLVLRMTNDEIETDLQRAIEKIRAVVRFRRAGGKIR